MFGYSYFADIFKG